MRKGQRHTKESKDKMVLSRTKQKDIKCCNNCGISFSRDFSRKSKFCSRVCFSMFRDNNLLGEKAWNWKGDKVGYAGLHKWIEKKLGKPRQCESCKTTIAKKYEWANKSHAYKREMSDWIRLCCACHHYFDGTSKVKPFNYQKI